MELFILGVGLGTLLGFFSLVLFIRWGQKSFVDQPYDEVILRPHRPSPFYGTRVPDRLPEEL